MRIFVLFLYFFQQLVAGVVLPVLPSGIIYPEGTFSITNQKQHPSLVQYIDQESEAGEEDEQVDNSALLFDSSMDALSKQEDLLVSAFVLGKHRTVSKDIPLQPLYLLFENFRI